MNEATQLVIQQRDTAGLLQPSDAIPFASHHNSNSAFPRHYQEWLGETHTETRGLRHKTSRHKMPRHNMLPDQLRPNPRTQTPHTKPRNPRRIALATIDGFPHPTNPRNPFGQSPNTRDQINVLPESNKETAHVPNRVLVISSKTNNLWIKGICTLPNPFDRSPRSHGINLFNNLLKNTTTEKTSKRRQDDS